MGQGLFGVDQFVFFSFKEAGGGDTGPLGHHRGNVFGRNLFFQHLLVFLDGCKFLLDPCQFFLQVDDFAIADLGHPAQVTGSFGHLFITAGLVNLGCDASDFLDHIFLDGPLTFEAVQGVIQVGQFFLDVCQPFTGGRVRLFFQGLLFDFKSDPLTIQFVDLSGHGIDFDPQAAGCLVDQVNGLVWQEAVADVTI